MPQDKKPPLQWWQSYHTVREVTQTPPPTKTLPHAPPAPEPVKVPPMSPSARKAQAEMDKPLASPAKKAMAIGRIAARITDEILPKRKR